VVQVASRYGANVLSRDRIYTKLAFHASNEVRVSDVVSTRCLGALGVAILIFAVLPWTLDKQIKVQKTNVDPLIRCCPMGSVHCHHANIEEEGVLLESFYSREQVTTTTTTGQLQLATWPQDTELHSTQCNTL